MLSFFARIISSVIAFLFMLFPNNGNLQYSYLQQTNSPEIAESKIIEAVTEKDIDALEAMMCLNIKQNTENLHVKIGELLDAIDGEITEITGKPGISYYERREDGRTINQDGIWIYIKTSTSTDTFFLSVIWESANTFSIEETGIRGIALQDPDGYSLVRINATEGVGEWHD